MIIVYKLIKGNLTTFVENLNVHPEADIIAFTCSNDGSLLVALVKISKEAIVKEERIAKGKREIEEALKAKAIADEKAAKKAALEAELAKLDNIAEIKDKE